MKGMKAAGIFVLSCIVFWWLYKETVFDIVLGKLGRYSNIIQNPFASLLLIILVGTIATLIYLQVANKKFHTYFVYGFYLTYFLGICYFLLGRRIVFRAIELNPFAFISYFGVHRGGYKNVFNIALFIPLGVLLHGLPLKKIIPLSLLGLILIEVAQYVSYVGVLDLSDIMLNFAGICIGLLVGTYFAKKGVEVVNSLKGRSQTIAGNVEE